MSHFTDTEYDNAPFHVRIVSFSCDECGRRWRSANGSIEDYQKCKNCYTECYPVSYKIQAPNKLGNENRETYEAHNKELCGKCERLGRSCMMLGNKDSFRTITNADGEDTYLDDSSRLQDLQSKLEVERNKHAIERYDLNEWPDLTTLAINYVPNVKNQTRSNQINSAFSSGQVTSVGYTSSETLRNVIKNARQHSYEEEEEYNAKYGYHENDEEEYEQYNYDLEQDLDDELQQYFHGNDGAFEQNLGDELQQYLYSDADGDEFEQTLDNKLQQYLYSDADDDEFEQTLDNELQQDMDYYKIQEFMKFHEALQALNDHKVQQFTDAYELQQELHNSEEYSSSQGEEEYSASQDEEEYSASQDEEDYFNEGDEIYFINDIYSKELNNRLLRRGRKHVLLGRKI